MKKTKKLPFSLERIRDLTADESKNAAGGWSFLCSEEWQGCGPAESYGEHCSYMYCSARTC